MSIIGSGPHEVPTNQMLGSAAYAVFDQLEIVPSTGGSFSPGITVPSLNGGQLAGLRNKIINGNMEISQRGTTFVSPGVISYTLDRWRQLNSTGVATITVSQQTDAPTGFQNSLRVAVTGADTSIAAGDYVLITQALEGFNGVDLIGRTFTLSFWVRSSKTGIHCVSFCNDVGDRSYVAEYTINVANTWEKKFITVPNGLITAGTWYWDHRRGLDIRFAMAGGTTFQTTPNAWQTGNFIATSNQVNCLDTIGNIFAITGVQLEAGSVATPFEYRHVAAELLMAQRYYYRLTTEVTTHNFGAGYVTSATQAVILVNFPVEMRAAPTALEQSGTAAHYGVQHQNSLTACSGVPTFSIGSPWNATVLATVASGLTTGNGCTLRAESTSAFLGFSAEI